LGEAKSSAAGMKARGKITKVFLCGDELAGSSRVVKGRCFFTTLVRDRRRRRVVIVKR
jgi:hypothetical protein